MKDHLGRSGPLRPRVVVGVEIATDWIAAAQNGACESVLVDASRLADLVGRIGHSQWAGVLLGSVSLPVVEHADCPVLLVPGVPEPVEATAPAHEEAAALGFA
jgi:nucleotide-binding universal stress UspA family protein